MGVSEAAGPGPGSRSCAVQALAQAPPREAERQGRLAVEICFQAPVEPEPPTFLTTNGRVIAIGDIHGDINKALACLEIAGVATFEGGEPVWTGGDTIVVQLGDILDRGDAEVATLMLLRSLGRQAERVGGSVHILNGNHESLNVCGDFRYVTAGAFAESGLIMGLDAQELQDLNKLVRARLMLYTPGGPMAVELSKNPTVLVVNDTAFAHGGLLPEHVAHGLKKINADVAAWMRGDRTPDGGSARPPFIAMGNAQSVMWNRTYGREVWPSAVGKLKAQRTLEEALDAIQCKRLVVGHTPQTQGANAECAGRVWRLDVGLSRNMLDARPAVLELIVCPDSGETLPRIIQ